MHWADKIAEQIIASGKFKPYWTDDMFTPSGYAHIGSIRGPLIHDLVFKALGGKNKAKSTYIFNDFDPIDGLPEELRKDFTKYMGFPLRVVPSPVPGYESFGEYFRKDFENLLRSLGIESEFLCSWDLYRAGKFNQVIKEALDNSENIQNIYFEVSGSNKKAKNWYPLQVVCENCGKLGTTRVFDWDGEKVSYKCEPKMVTWAEGCGFEGKMSPYDGKGKLPWKVDWPAHWKVLGITIEGSGKEHGTAGGSRDIARRLCLEVFNYPEPFNIVYEYFLIGGKKMSSSKGLGLKARDITNILPPQIARFLFIKTNYREQIEFDPNRTMAIPDLFDEYDKAWEAYDKNGDAKLARTYELSQIGKVPEKEKGYFAPRFRDIANYLSQGFTEKEVMEKMETVKGGKLDDSETGILEERIKYATTWIENYAPSEYRFELTEKIPDEAKKLSDEQKKYLQSAIQVIENDENPQTLQVSLYELAKSLGVQTKDAFAAIYLVLIGKNHGPRAGVLINKLEKGKVVDRIREVLKEGDNYV